MSIFMRLYAGLVDALAILAAALMGVMAISVVVDVCIRTAGGQPPGWTVPLSEYLLLYLTLCAAPWVLRQRGHVLIDSFVEIMSPALRLVVARFIYLLCASASLLIVFVAAGMTWSSFVAGETDVRAVLVPKFLLTLPFVPAFGLMAVEFLRLFAGHGSLYGGDPTAKSVA